MAYSNWGATVWCDGKALYHHCDRAIEVILGNRKPISNILLGAVLYDNLYHAVVGDEDTGFLLCRSKNENCN